MLAQFFGAVSGEVESVPENETGFAALEEMLGGDREAVCEILTVFHATTQEHAAALEVAIDMDDFAKAQALCHKMLPMFLQIGADEAKAEDYPDWQEEMRRLSEIIGEVMALIERKYLAS